MTDKKITELDAATTLVGADYMVVVKDVATTPVTNKILLSDAGITDGWVGANGTWTYASATTITVPSGATSIYSEGDKIKLTQTTVKYFYVVGVADTLLTVTGGSDYTVADAAISSNYYSKVATPVGFPQWFNFTPVWTNLTIGSGTQAAKYSRVGNTVEIDIRVTLAADSSVGTTPHFTLPVSSINMGTSSVQLRDTGVQNYLGYGSCATDEFYPYKVNVGASYLSYSGVTTTTPFTWGDGDAIYIHAVYGC